MIDFIEKLPILVILVFSVVVHEVAHGVAANRLGDPTAARLGRLTLNPLPHVDLFGTVLLPLLLFIMKSGFLIGWAKPVPVNPFNFQNPKKGMAITAAAGPLSNMAIAVVFAVVYRLLMFSVGLPGDVAVILHHAVFLNLLLAFFNLLPVPPLDGSRIMTLFLPEDAALKYNQLERYGMFIIFGMMFLGLFRIVVFPFVSFFYDLLMP